LVVRVVVHPDQIEKVRTSSEFRLKTTREKVNRLELRQALCLSSMHVLRFSRTRQYIDQGLSADELRTRINGPDGTSACDSRAHELPV
jgi:hypothetical protein